MTKQPLFVAAVKKGSIICTAKYTSWYEPVLLTDGIYDSDNVSLESLESIFEKELEKNPILIIGTKEDLKEMVDIFTDKSFNKAVPITRLIEADAAEGIFKTVNKMANPIGLFEKMLTDHNDRGLSHLAGLRIAHKGGMLIEHSDDVKAKDFLPTYRERLLKMGVLGLAPEADPDITIKDLARRFITCSLLDNMGLHSHVREIKPRDVLPKTHLDREWDRFIDKHQGEEQNVTKYSELSEGPIGLFLEQQRLRVAGACF